MYRCEFCGWNNPDGSEYCAGCGMELHPKYDVFISYSRKDYVDNDGNVIPNNMLSQIKATFKANGISYWFDEEGIYSGDEFYCSYHQSTQTSRNGRATKFPQQWNLTKPSFLSGLTTLHTTTLS